MQLNNQLISSRPNLVPSSIAANELGITTLALYYQVKRGGYGYTLVRKGSYRKVYYEQETVNQLKKIHLKPTLVDSKPKNMNDVVPPIYKKGDSVNFYQGRYKFTGTVKRSLKGDSYRVDSAEIGCIDLRWFEINLNC